MLHNLRIKLAFAATGLLLLLAMPHQLLHAGVWLIVHLYELLEFILDEIIHRLFATSRHTTQIIVFYLLTAMLLGLGYWLLRAACRGYRQLQALLLATPPKQRTQMYTALGIGGACIALLMLN